MQEALDTVSQNRENGGSLQNRLVVDLFLLNDELAVDRIRFFKILVSLSNSVNDSFAALVQDYPWFAGGDAPLFGVHVTDGVPHLRGCCLYGPSVMDEWAMIGAVMEMSKKLDNVIVKFWDADDGQILLIESAIVLPDWVDDIGPVACENRCWVQLGVVTLIRPNMTQGSLLLKDAIKCLRENRLTQTSSTVQAAIEQRLSSFDLGTSNPWKAVGHRTAIVLPRKIAIMLHKLPSLLNCAVASFERFCYSNEPSGTLSFDDLVWTTHRMGRTSFALLRSLQTPAWESDDHIPTCYKSAEVNRMKRTCQMEATPHLRHALQLGLRVTAGLDYVVGKASGDNGEAAISAEERILRHWTAIDVASGGDGTWLQKAWVAGPNESKIDLSGFIACPIEHVDLREKFPFPRTNPCKTLESIILNNLVKAKGPIEEPSYIIPVSADVDEDHWLHIQGNEQALDALLPHKGSDQHPLFDTGECEGDQEKPLDELLDNFTEFVNIESDVQGVATDDSAGFDYDKPVLIDPKLFLNLLHKVLTSTPEEISNLTTKDDADPYFGHDDYDMADDDGETNDIIASMDLELRIDSRSKAGEGEGIDNERLAQDEQVLAGLIASLDASEAAPGPVRNILQEMTKNR